jgi:quercetin dioxygenase-like cupin family protein
MSNITFDEFEAGARAQGFDEVLERQWKPLTVVDSHVHPFAAKALVVHGEMWLTVANHTRHLKAGDSFELDRDISHAERYGSEGATYWVARRG